MNFRIKNKEKYFCDEVNTANWIRQRKTKTNIEMERAINQLICEKMLQFRALCAYTYEI